MKCSFVKFLFIRSLFDSLTFPLPLTISLQVLIIFYVSLQQPSLLLISFLFHFTLFSSLTVFPSPLPLSLPCFLTSCLSFPPPNSSQHHYLFCFSFVCCLFLFTSALSSELLSLLLFLLSSLYFWSFSLALFTSALSP